MKELNYWNQKKNQIIIGALHIFDAFILNRFKHFRSLGISVEDSLELIEKSDVDSVIEKLKKRKNEIEKEIKKLNEQLEGINNTRKNLEIVKSGGNNYEIKYIKDKVFIPASKGLDFTISEYDTFSKFVDMLPISEYCSRIKNAYIMIEIWFKRIMEYLWI